MTDKYVPPAFAEHFETEPPEVLHHYTSRAGLLGIIEGKELWCTKVQYMNDATEFGRALDLARKRLDEIIEQTPLDLGAPDIANAAAASKRDMCFKLAFSLRGLEEINIFAACFCEDGDLLSQWRGYAGGSQGYSIGFDVERLKKSYQTEEYTLGKCIYDPDVQSLIVNQAIRKCLNDELAIPSQSQWSGHGPLANILFHCGAFFKEPSFAEEKEWRLVSPIIWFHDEHIGFRSGKSMVTPYYRLPIAVDKMLPVRGVMVGPCPHMELSRWSVKALLMKNGVSGPLYGQEVAPGSSIPFRDW